MLKLTEKDTVRYNRCPADEVRIWVENYKNRTGRNTATLQQLTDYVNEYDDWKTESENGVRWFSYILSEKVICEPKWTEKHKAELLQFVNDNPKAKIWTALRTL